MLNSSHNWTAILAVIATHIAPTQVSLVTLCQGIGKRTIQLELWPWDIRGPDGASNSRCMCLACWPYRHLGRQYRALQLGSGSESLATTTWWCGREHWPSWWRKVMADMHRWTGVSARQGLLLRSESSDQCARGSSGANSGGGVKALTCRPSCYAVSGLGRFLILFFSFFILPVLLHFFFVSDLSFLVSFFLFGARKRQKQATW